MTSRKTSARHVPLRKCIWCGKKGPKSRLLRLALMKRGEDWIVSVDERQKMPGRGAYLCREGQCMDAAFSDLRRFRACLDRAFKKRTVKNLDFSGVKRR